MVVGVLQLASAAAALGATIDDAPVPGANQSAPVTLTPTGKWFGFNNMPSCHDNALISTPLFDRGFSCATEDWQLDATHANTGRIQISWHAIEPTMGQYNETYLDKVEYHVARYDSLGIKPILQVAATPDWASETQGHTADGDEFWRGAVVDSPTVNGRWSAFIGELISRFGTRAAALEIWNEPNLAGWNWRRAGNAPMDIARYTRLFQAAAAASRAVNSTLPVITGGLSTEWADVSWTRIDTERFLREMYQAGLEPASTDPVEGYDGLGIHIYPTQVGYELIEPGEAVNGFARRYNLFKAGYQDYDPAPRLWVTEVGVTTTGYQMFGAFRVPQQWPCGGVLQPACNPSVQFAVSQGDQANGLEWAIRWLYSIPNVDAVIVHRLYDMGSDCQGQVGTCADGPKSSDREQGFGVIRTPAYGQTELKSAWHRIVGMG